jgi:electron transport complex protein RnfB
MMEQYLFPILIVTGIGLLAGVILTVASKFMAVKVNDAVAKVRDVLPGANCGACGYAGCDDYAAALATDHTVKANLCTPGGSSAALAVSKVLGIKFESVEGKYAIVKCFGTFDKTRYIMDFKGIQSCNANKMFYRGRGACSRACLGYGDCVKACGYGAISLVNGVAVVDKRKCVGCSVCVKKCPNHLISIVPSGSTTYVGCSSPDNGARTHKICKAGCIACRKCEKVCKFDAISISNNTAVIDPAKCKNCGMCIKECPVGIIKSNKKKAAKN